MREETVQMVQFHYSNVRAAFYLNLSEFNSHNKMSNRLHEKLIFVPGDFIVTAGVQRWIQMTFTHTDSQETLPGNLSVPF